MYKVRKINFGWYKRRHGILLENLPPSKQKLLNDNLHMKWLDADTQAFEVIFKVDDMNDHERSLHKIYWNPYLEEFTEYKDVEKASGLVDWTCAICKVHIKARWDHTKVENFVCKNCGEVHHSKNTAIDQRIVESANAFMNHCKDLFKGEQREFMSYTKKSLKF